MSSEFERDRDTTLADVAVARDEFLGVVRELSAADLAVGRRGGWTVAAILQHVIDVHWYHAKGIAYLREQEAVARGSDAEERSAPSSAEEALASLAESGAALRSTVEGVDEEAFYRLRKVGGQEWSVLSFLEGTADHDREHAAQIRTLLGR